MVGHATYLSFGVQDLATFSWPAQAWARIIKRPHIGALQSPVVLIQWCGVVCGSREDVSKK